MADFLTIIAIAGAAALAPPVGGLIALWRKPTTLFMSVALGFASGVLLATICFEMLPQALEMSSLPVAVGGSPWASPQFMGSIFSFTAANSWARRPSSVRRLKASISSAGHAETR